MSIEQSIPSIGGGGLSGTAAVAVIMFIVLIPFFAFRELSLVIGKERMRDLFFKIAGNRSAMDLGHVR